MLRPFTPNTASPTILICRKIHRIYHLGVSNQDQVLEFFFNANPLLHQSTCKHFPHRYREIAPNPRESASRSSPRCELPTVSQPNLPSGSSEPDYYRLVHPHTRNTYHAPTTIFFNHFVGGDDLEIGQEPWLRLNALGVDGAADAMLRGLARAEESGGGICMGLFPIVGKREYVIWFGQGWRSILIFERCAAR